MSEGATHARLVAELAKAIRATYGASAIDVAAECSETWEYPLPPTFARVRPDVFAIGRAHDLTVIGEAKSVRDIDTRHTRDQLRAYLEHLTTVPQGHLWLAVPMAQAGEAVRVARSMRSAVGCRNVELVISAWLLGRESAIERRWHG